MSYHYAWQDPIALAIIFCLSVVGAYCATKAWSDFRLNKRWIWELGAICAGVTLLAAAALLVLPFGDNNCCC